MIWFTLAGALAGLLLLALARDALKLLNPRMAHEPLSIAADQRKERRIGAGDRSAVEDIADDSIQPILLPGRIGAAPRRRYLDGGGMRGGDSGETPRPRRGINENTGAGAPSVDVGAASERSVGVSEPKSTPRTETDELLPAIAQRPQLDHLQLDGNLHVPDRVYVGQNFRLQIEINCSPAVDNGALATVSYEARSQGGYTMRIDRPLLAQDDDLLEVQVIAAGAAVSPENTLFVPLEAGDHVLDWSCSFAKSETQTMTFAFHHRSGTRRKRLGSFDHTIRVMQFAGFTERQLRAIGYVVGGLGGVLTIVGGALSVLDYLGFAPLT